VVEIRSASPDDVEQIVALQRDRNGADTEPGVRALLADREVGLDRFTVAVDGAQVVSSLCLMAEVFHLEGVALAVGRPEYVATASGYEHRGLVRRQMEVVHRWSRERGDLLSIVTGVPYFYRRFGYEYAVAFPRVRLMTPGADLSMPVGWTVRRAEPSDLPAILALEERIQEGVALRATREESWWRFLLSGDEPDAWYVATQDGVVRGSAALGPGIPGLGTSVTMVHGVAAERAEAVWALATEAAARGLPVAVEERRGLAHVVDASSTRHGQAYALYVRVPDPVALLDRLRPALGARLARSPHAASSGRLVLSLFPASVVLTYERGEVIAVEAGPRQQWGREHPSMAVPPDLVATLVFGRYGAAGLAERHDDVLLGPAADLVEVLFPKLSTDLALSI
jgi:predicted N-acetyltransferase YhbS